MMVLLDTNFITVPEQFGIDIFTEIKKIVPQANIQTLSQVIDELKSLNTKAAKVGLQLLKINKIKIIKKNGKADDLLMEVAQKEQAIIATNDKELKQRAIKKNIKIIFIRSKKKIEIIGGEKLV